MKMLREFLVEIEPSLSDGHISSDDGLTLWIRLRARNKQHAEHRIKRYVSGQIVSVNLINTRDEEKRYRQMNALKTQLQASINMIAEVEKMAYFMKPKS